MALDRCTARTWTRGRTRARPGIVALAFLSLPALLGGCATVRFLGDRDSARYAPPAAAPACASRAALTAAFERDDGALTIVTRYTDDSPRHHRWDPPPGDPSWPGPQVEALAPLGQASTPELEGRRLAVDGPDAEVRLAGDRLERHQPEGGYLAIGRLPREPRRAGRAVRLTGPPAASQVAGSVALLSLALAFDAATLPLQVVLYPLYVLVTNPEL